MILTRSDIFLKRYTYCHKKENQILYIPRQIEAQSYQAT